MNKRVFAVFLSSFAGFLSYAQEAVPSSVADAVSRNTFEVVVPKPEIDPLRYETELPTELLPYAERTDPYYSIGTAFAISDGRFVTAAHVLSLDGRTLTQEAALRDSLGKIHPIESILAYSNRRDFAVFSVQDLSASGLSLTAQPALNSRVYSVGNALGSGVVIREGLLTSITPEREAGEWQWLRFSAAASPGNSGGPLLNTDGQVVGVVCMRSENENLNYALPADELSFEPRGVYATRAIYRFPHMTVDTKSFDSAEFDLPRSPTDLRALLTGKVEEWGLRMADDILVGKASACFPDAQGTDGVIGDTTFSLIPMTAEGNPDKTWSLKKPDSVKSAKVGKDGYVETGEQHGGTYFDLKKPTGVKVADLFEKPRTLFDLILSGWPLYRTYASQKIRILSFGEPESVERLEDRWGRLWVFAVWPVAWANKAQILIASPTPRGATGMLAICSYNSVYAYRKDYRRMAQDSTFSYMANLDEWKEWLTTPDLLPPTIRSMNLEYLPQKSFRFEGEELSLRFDESLAHIADDSLLALIPTFYREGDDVLWRIGRLYYQDGPSNDRYIHIGKLLKPNDTTSDSVKRYWDKAIGGSYPFDGSSFVTDDRTSIMAARVPRSARSDPSSAPYIFDMKLSEKGNPENSDFKRRFNQLKNALTLREAARPDSADRGSNALIDGMSVFQALSEGNMETLAKFIQGKIDLGAVNDDGRTPFMLALRLQRADAVADLLEAGVDVDHKDNFGQSSLNLALRYADEVTARKLVELGSDIGAVDDEGYTPLMLAMPPKFGDLPDRLLDRGVDYKRVNTYDKQALFYALVNGPDRSALAKRLILAGADLNLISYDKWTPLMAAIRYSTPEIVDLLLERGAQMVGKDADGWTPLHLALRNGKADAAKRLIALGKYVRDQTSNGYTPLYLASGYSTLENVSALIALGADPRVSDVDGKTPLMIAIQEKNTDVVSALMGLPGALESVSSKGWTTLHFAAKYGNAEQVSTLLARGLDARKETFDGVTPLMFAIDSKNYDGARRLLDVEGAWDGQDSKGFTALHYALFEVPEDIAVRILAKKGSADIDAVTVDGFTALYLAARYQRPFVVKSLLEKGASPAIVAKNGWSPLMQALRYGSEESARLIAASDDAFGGENVDGWNALHICARYKPDLIPLIGPHFTDLDIRTRDGWTALHEASYSGSPKAVRWLIDHGADASLSLPDGKSVLDVAASKKKKAIETELKRQKEN